MRAKLSVVIPTLNAAEALPACLAALMEGVEAGLIRELVISDGGSQDATLAIAEEAGAVQVSGPPSRGGQLRRGAGAAAGDWLLFLHADSRLPGGWAEIVTAQMEARAARLFPAEIRYRRDGGEDRRRMGQPAVTAVQPALWRSGVADFAPGI